MSEHEPRMAIESVAGVEIATYRAEDVIATWRSPRDGGVFLRPYGLVLRVDAGGNVTTEWPPVRAGECENCDGRGEICVELDPDGSEEWERCEACRGRGR